MRVSIGIPCYNAERYVARAIESCLEQSVKPFEIIVCDDGSSDKTEWVASGYVPFGVVMASNGENRGIGYTRNRIISLCRGDVLLFLSADDVLLPHAVETVMSYAERYPDSFLYSDYYIINERGERIGEYRAPEFGTREEFVKACVESARQDRMFVAYCISARIELWRKIPFWEDKKIGEDLAHLLESVLVHDARFVHIPFPLFCYRIHSDMQTNVHRNRIHENNLDTFSRINRMLGTQVVQWLG